MILNNLNYYINDPVLLLGIIAIFLLSLNFVFSLYGLLNNTLIKNIRVITISINLVLATQLLIRWYSSGHFPVSNLYESLCFLSWSITLGQLIVEREFMSPIISTILTPLSLLFLCFGTFILPDNLITKSNIVPALRSNWLMMHVTVVMLSYAALLIGSLFSAYLLFIDNDKKFQIRSSSYGAGNYRSYIDSKNLYGTINFSSAEILDTLSYRTIGIGFVLLTFGLISGAVWANEAWGTWWSWDPKETWAFISWLFYAAYLHTRISKGWSGKKSAVFASFGTLVIFTCYIGVNFLGIGLHSYGWFL